MANKVADYWQDFYHGRADQLSARDFMQALGYHPDEGSDYEALFQRLQEQIETKLDLRSEHRFLDIACGFGSFSRVLGGRAQFAVGTDLTRILLQKGYELERALEWPSTNGFLQANAVAQPFKAQSFDRILCFGMFFHLDQNSAKQVVEEILRLLRPGGRALIGDIAHPRRIHFERSYVERIPRLLHYPLLQALRLKGAVDRARGRVVFYGYGPEFFERQVPSDVRCEVFEGRRDGRRNNLARYDVAIQLPA